MIEQNSPVCRRFLDDVQVRYGFSHDSNLGARFEKGDQTLVSIDTLVSGRWQAIPRRSAIRTRSGRETGAHLSHHFSAVRLHGDLARPELRSDLSTGKSSLASRTTCSTA